MDFHGRPRSQVQCALVTTMDEIWKVKRIHMANWVMALAVVDIPKNKQIFSLHSDLYYDSFGF